MTAHEDLRDALAALLDDDDRPPCCWPDVALWWLSEDRDERARAAEHCHGCVILDRCHAAAESTGERFGVWAGCDRTPKPRPKPEGKPATPKPRQTVAPVVCRGCSSTFTPKRKGQEWCRQGCRTKAASAERRRRARQDEATPDPGGAPPSPPARPSRRHRAGISSTISVGVTATEGAVTGTEATP